MNFIQRNPNDPKHAEFHDGEYEYWPSSGSTKKKSISFPAAMVSGLELIAATAAAGLLAMALSTLYATFVPRTIGEYSAVINANIYNNHSDEDIQYILTPAANPDLIYQEGTLEDDEDTLRLSQLNPGTTYLLQLYDQEQNSIGEFQFTTIGEIPVGGDSQPSGPAQQPQEPNDPGVDPGPLDPEPKVPKDDPPDPETTPTEEPTEPTKPSTPPVIYNPKPSKPDPTPDDKPKPPPTTDQEPEDPEPDTPSGPSVKPNLTYHPSNSGVPISYFDYTETHTFSGIFSDYVNVSVTLTLGESVPEEFDNFRAKPNSDGTLDITTPQITLSPGNKVTTTVTVTTSDNTELVSENTFAPPMFDRNGVTLSITDGICVITAKVLPEGAEPMTDCKATLMIYNNNNLNDTISDILLSKDSSSDTYRGTHTIPAMLEFDKIEVEVTGSYLKNGEPQYHDICTKPFNITP